MKNTEKPIVLHVLKSSIYSGAENVVFTIIKSLQDEYHFIYVATDGEIRKQLEQEQISKELLPDFNRKALKKVIRKYQPDIVHAHDFSATVLCASISGPFRLISHLHYDPPWSRCWNIKTIAYALYSRKVDRILTVSKKLYEVMAFSDLLDNKTTAIGNPIDKTKIVELASQEIGLKTYDILFVGRFVEQKAPERFIHVVDILFKRGLKLQCVMLGDGNLRSNCENLIKTYGLGESVEILGFKENPYVYMKKSRVLCMTSLWEGYGLVAAEANILEVPVVSTRTGGVTELFGADAFELCDTDREIADKLELLLTNEVEYQIWKQRAIDRTGKFCSIDDYRNQISLLYEKERK